MEQIITSLLDQDAYKFSMGQAIFHQHNGKQVAWSFKCRNKDVRFGADEVAEIKRQIELYTQLHFTEEELAFLAKKFVWLKKDYIDFLRFWHPRMDEIKVGTDSPCGLSIEISGSAVNVSPYETPIMAIVTETHYKMSGKYGEMLAEFKKNVDDEIDKMNHLSGFL